MRLDPLDAISPDEAHLSPSQRTWARTIRGVILEIRDPNDGQGTGPAEKTRHQYTVGRGYLWRRTLPPAPLDQPDDETPFRDAPLRWQAVDDTLIRHSPIWLWAVDLAASLGESLGTPISEPIAETGERNPDGTGRREHTVYRMPPRHPATMWHDITTYRPEDGGPVSCPVEGCDQHLVWYEAGYVPGYRVCTATTPDGAGQLSTIRHHFLLDSTREWPEVALVLVER